MRNSSSNPAPRRRSQGKTAQKQGLLARALDVLSPLRLPMATGNNRVRIHPIAPPSPITVGLPRGRVIILSVESITNADPPLSLGRKSFLKEYESFIRNHDEARKRYFEQYCISYDQRRRQLEVRFFKAVEKLRKFEDQMTEEQWAVVHRKKWKIYHKDSTYSENHNLTGPEAPAKEFTDSMMTSVQLNLKGFSEDMEESIGTIEDYKKYQEEK